MKRFKNILFVADREDGLAIALDRAAAVLRTNNARLTVMDVTPETGLADYFQSSYGVDLNAQLRGDKRSTAHHVVLMAGLSIAFDSRMLLPG